MEKAAKCEDFALCEEDLDDHLLSVQAKMSQDTALLPKEFPQEASC